MTRLRIAAKLTQIRYGTIKIAATRLIRQNAITLATIASQSRVISPKASPGFWSLKKRPDQIVLRPELHDKKQQRHLGASSAATPDQPAGDRHRQIEDRPDRAEHAIRRRPPRLSQARIPLGQARIGPDPADPGGGETECQENGQSERVLDQVVSHDGPGIRILVMGPGHREPLFGILAVVRFQLLVEFRVLLPELGRLLEEALGGHGEELGRVGGPVRVEHGLAALAARPGGAARIRAQDAGPGDVPAAAASRIGAPSAAPSSWSSWWANSCRTTFCPSRMSAAPLRTSSQERTTTPLGPGFAEPASAALRARARRPATRPPWPRRRSG